mmetsp:Transcript_18999/g.38206  ORF Transcript_18999/g.38206 Transcript_18999/m.38206 type:complete len:246 (-) Transcript_18999:1102-1839(-)
MCMRPAAAAKAWAAARSSCHVEGRSLDKETILPPGTRSRPTITYSQHRCSSYFTACKTESHPPCQTPGTNGAVAAVAVVAAATGSRGKADRMIVSPTEDRGIMVAITDHPDTATIEEQAAPAAAAAGTAGTTTEKEEDAARVAGGVAMETLLEIIVVAGRMHVTMDMVGAMVGLLVPTRRHRVRGETMVVRTVGPTIDRIIMIIGNRNAGAAETMVRAVPVGSSRGPRRKLLAPLLFPVRTVGGG